MEPPLLRDAGLLGAEICLIEDIYDQTGNVDIHFHSADLHLDLASSYTFIIFTKSMHRPHLI